MSFNQAFVVVIPSAVNADSDMSDEVSSMVDDTQISSIAGSSSKTGRSLQSRVASGGGDLRKKLLK
jgi:paired amphipathic helix protein Sin3a